VVLALSLSTMTRTAPSGDEAVAAKITGAALVSSRAYETVAHLADRIGPRLSGSAELERAVRYTADRFREQGADRVWTEPVKVPHWVRGLEAGWLEAPVEGPLHLTALGGSVPTPAGGIRGEVVEFASLDELKASGEKARGKIVLLNRDMARDTVSMSGYGDVSPLRRDGAVESAKRGAIAVLVRSLGTAAFQLPHTGAFRYDEAVPKIPAAAVTEEDADWIHRLLAAGDSVRVKLELGCRTLPDADSANVVAELRGRGKPDEVVVIGAHLDAWDLGTGAIDDGAGVAMVMETLRILKMLDLIPQRTIRAVLFTNEENGLAGGKNYAKVHAQEMPKHVAAIEADSGAARPFGFSVNAGPGAVDIVKTIAARLGAIGADQVKAGGGGADISPMKPYGVPQIGLWQDTTYYFDWHHTAADTLDKVDRHELDRNVAAMAVLAYFLADRDEPLPRYVPTPEELKGVQPGAWRQEPGSTTKP
jgi:hypothetical protein